LAGIVRTAADEELVVECLGILGNLSLPELDFESLVTEFELIPFINE
jgi:hypothetical protein